MVSNFTRENRTWLEALLLLSASVRSTIRDCVAFRFRLGAALFGSMPRDIDQAQTMRVCVWGGGERERERERSKTPGLREDMKEDGQQNINIRTSFRGLPIHDRKSCVCRLFAGHWCSLLKRQERLKTDRNKEQGTGGKEHLPASNSYKLVRVCLSSTTEEKQTKILFSLVRALCEM
jgi:hypothetical protein